MKTKWLIIFESGYQEIAELEDFYDLHAQYSSDDVLAVIKLIDDIKMKEKCE